MRWRPKRSARMTNKGDIAGLEDRDDVIGTGVKEYPGEAAGVEG